MGVKEGKKLLKKEPSPNRKNRRLLARVRDSFLISFSIVKEEWYKKNRELYISKRTMDRDNLPINPSLLRFSMSTTRSIDPAIYHILLHINKKLDVLLETLPNKEEFEIIQQKQNEATCEDISGGGIRMRCDYPLSKGDILNLIIPLPDKHSSFIITMGRIKRIYKVLVEATEKDSNEFGVEFLAINDEDKEKVISYSFKRQREMINLERNKDEN
ncbi:MAG TPA: PilZ domain-containing protein [Nitrospinota bacterium]|nr:PilZ domain-containing protein [Nitrospinota bacterium]